MALLEVVFQSTFAGQECINRFNYLSSGIPAAVSHSFALTSALGCIYDPDGIPIGYPQDTVFHRIRQAQSNQVVYDLVSVRDVYSATDFYESPFVQVAAGAISGESMTPAVAYGMRTSRTRADIRRGQKRFVGVAESAVGNGGVIDSGFASTWLNPLAVKLAEVIGYTDEGNTLTYTPVIAGKFKYNPDPLKPTVWAYKYYADPVEQMDNLASGFLWEPYGTVRTQTSRQYGRGR